MSGPKKTFVYVGLGCFGLSAVMMGVLLFGMYKVRQWGAGYAAKVEDPATQLAETQRILGAKALPDGYGVYLTLPLPFMDTVHISDAPGRQGKAGGYGERGFLFYRGPYSPLHDRAYREYLEAKSEDIGMPYLDAFVKSAKLGERIRSGKLELGGGTDVRFSSRRANLRGSGGPEEAIINLLAVGCPGGQRITRVAVWYSPDPEPGKPVNAADLRGSAADESALSAFLGHFQLCQPKTDVVLPTGGSSKK
ncbi:MAG TPA: hypothetical protein VK447_18460 [Myxococcaceae bacterium]|nr:hypothetical protein [Myxococcaceae bacterium]